MGATVELRSYVLLYNGRDREDVLLALTSVRLLLITPS